MQRVFFEPFKKPWKPKERQKLTPTITPTFFLKFAVIQKGKKVQKPWEKFRFYSENAQIWQGQAGSRGCSTSKVELGCEGEVCSGGSEGHEEAFWKFPTVEQRCRWIPGQPWGGLSALCRDWGFDFNISAIITRSFSFTFLRFILLTKWDPTNWRDSVIGGKIVEDEEQIETVILSLRMKQSGGTLKGTLMTKRNCQKYTLSLAV